jgi:hypothetical protein
MKNLPSPADLATPTKLFFFSHESYPRPDIEGELLIHVPSNQEQSRKKRQLDSGRAPAIRLGYTSM